MPQFSGSKITIVQLEQFIKDAIDGKVGSNNLYRLSADGSTVKPTVKVFYEGRVGGSIGADNKYSGGAFNSVLANDFIERAGDGAVSLDRTKLGQFVLRSQLEMVVEGGLEEADKFVLNRTISAAYATQNPVETNVVFAGDKGSTNPNYESILWDNEIPKAINVSSATATFNGVTDADIKAGYIEGDTAANKLHNKGAISDAFQDANRIGHPKLYMGPEIDPANGRLINGAMDVDARWVQKIAGNVTLSPIDVNQPQVGEITTAAAAAEQAFSKTLLALGDKAPSFVQALYEGSNPALQRSVALLTSALANMKASASGALESMRGNAFEAWRAIVDSSSKAVDATYAQSVALLKNLARWQKSFFEAVPDFFENLPEPIRKAGTFAVQSYKQFWNDTLGLFKYSEYTAANAIKLTGVWAGNILILGHLAVEAKRTGGVTNTAFLGSVLKTGLGLAVGIPVFGALAEGAAYVAGAAGVYALIAAGLYLGVRTVLSEAEQVWAASHEQDSIIYKMAHGILENMRGFEAAVASLPSEVLSLFVGSAQASELTPGIDNMTVGSIQVAEAGAAVYTFDEKAVWLFGHDDGVLIGGKENDILIHTGHGLALGQAGDDMLVGFRPDFIAKGTKIGTAPAAGAVDNRKVAQTDLSLTLDGGAGDDWVLALGGEKAITIGGVGRDWIYNTSDHGIIYGDTIDGLDPDSQLSIRDLEKNGQDLDAEGHHKFADNIWWSPGTTVIDAGHYDHLKFYGVPLVGGDTSGSISMQLWAGPASGLVSSAIGAAQMFVRPKDSFYFDNLMPWIQYKMDLTKGRQDMLVINVFDTLWNGLFDAIPNPDAGVMRIKNFDFVGSYTGWTQSSLANEGTFGMVFKKANPIWAVLANDNSMITRRFAA